MQTLEVVILLGVAILLGQMTSTRVRLAPPIVLMVLGVLVTFVPGAKDVGLPAEMVLMLFLPILLYWDALNTSMRELRRMLRGIILNGTLLVVFTAFAVAFVAHGVFDLDWGTAWIIGAAVAPTDATAVSVLGRGLSRRQTTTLKAESLINDGTALVVYALAIELATGEARITVGHTGAMFAVSFLGGLAIGLGGGWIIGHLARRMTVPVYINVLMLLTPFAIYMAAEAIEASGVLAVVVCGLYFSQVGPKFFSARSRQLANPFWSMTTFLLNGALFVLVGSQLPDAVQSVRGHGLTRALLVGVAVYLTTLVARFVFIHVSIAIIRTVDRRPYQRTLRTTFPARVVSVLAGFRGAVSMAVALSVPMALESGEPFPERDLIVLVVAGVVVLSLVVQGVVFPLAVRWAGTAEENELENERRLAWETSRRELWSALPDLARRHEIPEDVLAAMQEDLESKWRRWKRDPEADEETQEEQASLQSTRWQQEVRLRVAALRHQRRTMIRLRDEGTIDDEALGSAIARLDLEELRLTGPVEVE